MRAALFLAALAAAFASPGLAAAMTTGSAPALSGGKKINVVCP